MAKIRISRDLYDRAAVCAAAVGEPVGRWLALCQRPGNLERARTHLGKSGVSIPEKMVIATRAASLSATADGEIGNPAEFRRNVAAVVLFCERTRAPEFVSVLREGVDYLVERGEDW